MTLPPNGFLALFVKDKVTKDPCYWDLDFEPSEKTRGGQAKAFVGLGIWLGRNCLSWILIVDLWVLSPDIPLAASHCYLDCPEPPNHPKSFVVLQRGLCLIEPITKDPFEGVLFWGGGVLDQQRVLCNRVFK